ncbi:DUF4258 domain-containing protein [uncultured Thiohalocapsa sp.]|uniref:DUF4258 domain-containing protein n=1 Tax=uncultured Thiohalocapsa sp. TaxID=768990 RepID=UPI00345D0F91
MKARLKEFRECIRTNRYIVTTHAAEELDDDGLTIYDLERVILSGHIVDEQKDRDPPETKFLVRGPTLDDDVATVVVKPGPTNKLIIITVFRDSYD